MHPTFARIVLADPVARAVWIAWMTRLHERRQLNARRATFRSTRGAA